MQYPRHIIDEIEGLGNRPILYILEVECEGPEPTYKFGITTEIGTRVRTHCRKLGIRKVVKLFDCKYDSVMRCVETEFKRYAKSIGVMVTKFNQTEILVTNDIGTYIERISGMIAAELLKPQPENVRKLRADNIANTSLKCDLCGRTFRDESDFKRHRNKKKPCVILEVSDEDMKNPLRCVHCNKIYSKKENLTRHHQSCKMKSNNNLPSIVQQNITVDGRKLREEIQKSNIEYIKEINEINKKHNSEVDCLLSKHNVDISTAMLNHVKKMRSIIGKHIPSIEGGNEGAEEHVIIQNFLEGM